MEVLWIGLAASLLVVAGIAIAASLRRVPEGHEFVVERFGRFRRTLEPGMHWLVPLAERISARHTISEQSLEVRDHALTLSDTVTIRIHAVCAYQIVNVGKAAYEVADHASALRDALLGALTEVLGSVGVDRLLVESARLAERVRENVEAASAAWGIRIIRVDLVELNLPEAITEAAAAQKQATIERETARARAEAAAEERLSRAEAERRIAEMDAEAERLRAERLAAARERELEADVRAALMLAEALKSDSRTALDYMTARAYVAALARLAESDNHTVLAMPTDALAAHLGAILQRQGNGRPAPDEAPAAFPFAPRGGDIEPGDASGSVG